MKTGAPQRFISAAGRLFFLNQIMQYRLFCTVWDILTQAAQYLTMSSLYDIILISERVGGDKCASDYTVFQNL